MINPEKRIFQNDYQDNKFAQSLFDEVKAINFGSNRQIVAVNSQEVVAKMKEAGITLDYRAIAEPTDESASVFKGLDFDPEKIRSQAFTILENGEPIAIMTFIIAPRNWIQKQKYFKKENQGVTILDAKSVASGSMPEYYVIPAWTKVVDSHRGKLALPGVRAFNGIIQKITAQAPDNTWMEVSAQGVLPRKEMEKVAEFLNTKQVNDLIANDDLPFDSEIIGRNTEGSSSTIKIATRLGMNQIKDLGSSRTLGPVFAKKIK